MSDTRGRLLDAAEALYAARGVDAVSLREILQEAGARNATAVQYHFGDRAGILRAIFARHAPDVEARRHALLDAYEDGEPGVRPLAAALVRPLAARLADASGRAYLQIWADVVNRPDPIVPVAVLDDPSEAVAGGSGGSSLQMRHDSLCRWRALVEPLLEEDAARLHRRFTAILYASIELARRARSGPRTDDRLFTSYLIDVVAAILGAPVSPETRRLAAERDAARR
ncbi:TetR/AcrR family transcriptional regulator [Actinomadura bangladeshensis]|uniref:TetR/AcrR family transcriptional regulator n=1 Tax=Actinomadura bangladeshensis TaxID=453573 RepID=A0A4R4P557_9ACTN|nr:helix-turn-helix domain-containing protein [Actinomadura bangladeshensis]TDC16834.1 TetR/AcrR family transcriptional regulator [Actinomadura bangladeshensis]